ncbi:putative N-acetylserotonin O-methyltransferase-like protein [Hypsibius exemplaris]|uniref:N-acetylserotonin O-methyltransferase-like protein n=1 Tax=Hypsibius exemplaris TaxID=2072580 RepID=A0A1W0WM27_HYPEX|nr:putative N-acetylserotonin O-methyltransferase-like protein [Hypsibius exemplaris]
MFLQKRLLEVFQSRFVGSAFPRLSSLRKMSIIKALEFLNKSDVLLASGSPRRLELFSRMEVPFLSQLAIPESVEDMDYRNFPDPRSYVLANIRNKVQYALKNSTLRQSRWKSSGKDYEESFSFPFDAKRTPDIVIAADTVVVSGSDILEKPKSPEDNARMLRLLSGKNHSVLTAVSFCISAARQGDRQDFTAGVNLLNSDLEKGSEASCQTFAVETEVKFSSLDESVIGWYVKSKEGRGKAGGYAIQGLGSSLVESVNGCFYNVIGFPMNRFLTELNNSLLTSDT